MRQLITNLIITIIVILIIGGGIMTAFCFVQGYQHIQYHYHGETVVSDAEFHEIMPMIYDEDGWPVDNIYRLDYFNINVNGEGAVVLGYDFYSDGQVDYLDGKHVSVPSALWDIYALRTVSWILAFALLGILITVVIIAFTRQRKVYRRFRWLGSWYRRRMDRRHPDPTNPPNIVTSVSAIDTSTIGGLIGLRLWNVNRQGELKSVGMGTKWIRAEMFADSDPTTENNSGVHAYVVGSPIDADHGAVTGIVEIGGKYTYHPEGVVRAEYCRIIGLFVGEDRPRLGRLLSDKYKVPVYYERSRFIGYMHWLLSEVGINAVRHNAEILGLEG